jgi:hypothetical protein
VITISLICCREWTVLTVMSFALNLNSASPTTIHSSPVAVHLLLQRGLKSRNISHLESTNDYRVESFKCDQLLMWEWRRSCLLRWKSLNWIVSWSDANDERIILHYTSDQILNFKNNQFLILLPVFGKILARGEILARPVKIQSSLKNQAKLRPS